MSSETCHACWGSGYVTRSESVPNPSSNGGPLYVQVEVRNPCCACGGTGRIYTPDPIIPTRKQPRHNDRLPTQHKDRQQTPRAVRGRGHDATRSTKTRPAPLDADEKFANFLGIASIGVSLYVLFNTSQPANPLVKLTIAFAIGFVCSLFFQKCRRVTRVLRHVTAILFFSAMLGGSVYLWLLYRG